MNSNKKLSYRPPEATRVDRAKDKVTTQTGNYPSGGEPCKC
jgi:hypothetical protein